MAEEQKPIKPQYFIIREDDRMVPLVAVDELPYQVTIGNVPRMLTPKMLEGMTCVGTCKSRQQKYTLISADSPPSAMSISIAGNSLPPPAVDLKACPPESTSSTGRPADQSTPILPLNKPSSVTGRLSVPAKEFCSYWLRKGECDYEQQGCLYKHEMPRDLATLNGLGFRDIPTWYRIKYNTGSFLAAEGAAASFNPTPQSALNQASNYPQLLPSSSPREKSRSGRGRREDSAMMSDSNKSHRGKDVTSGKKFQNRVSNKTAQTPLRTKSNGGSLFMSKNSPSILQRKANDGKTKGNQPARTIVSGGTNNVTNTSQRAITPTRESVGNFGTGTNTTISTSIPLTVMAVSKDMATTKSIPPDVSTDMEADVEDNDEVIKVNLPPSPIQTRSTMRPLPPPRPTSSRQRRVSTTSTSSSCFDVEIQFIKEDQERHAREEAEYQAQIAASDAAAARKAE